MPAFISQWKTDNAGTSNDDQITLPLVSSGTYDFTVDWGDGSQDTITSHDDAAVTHTYATAGTYTVQIAGTISGWQFDDGGDKDKILDVSQWGDLAFGVNEGHFFGCSNLDVSATDAPDLTGVTSLENCFRESGIGEADLSAWDVSSVTDMSIMFFRSAFNGDVSAWDVSSVTTMQAMFRDSAFNGDLSTWDVSNVTTMREMFRSTPFNGDISGWDVSSVTNMRAMFFGSSFNGDLSAWDVSNVTTMASMFRSSFNGDLSAWDVSSVTNMASMFSFGDFNGDVSAWDVSSVTSMANMFRRTPFNGDISQWDVSSVTNMVSMFRDSSFNGDLSAWDVSSVTSMSSMFRSTPFNDETYSRCLIAWSRLPLQSGVEWSDTNAQYFSGAAAEARAKIAADFGWTISDNGEDTASTSYAVVGEVLDGTTPVTGEPVVWTSEQDVELDAVTSALHGEQVGRFAVMTTDELTFPNASNVNGTTVTLDSATFIYEQDVGLLGKPADVTTTQAAQRTSADTLVYRMLDAGTLQALQAVSASVIGISDASASTRQQPQRAEAAADVVATITLETQQQPQRTEAAADVVATITLETRQQPQRAAADPQRTTRVSVGTQQLPQGTTAAVGDLVRPRIQATSIRRAIDLQTSITRP